MKLIKLAEGSFDKFNMKLELMFMKHYAPNSCEPSIEALNFGGGGGGWGVRGWGSQGRCEWSNKVSVKI